MIAIRELTSAELEGVAALLPLHRLAEAYPERYLVAWEEDEPVGHVHIAWSETELGTPELQDMWVRPDLRGRGIGAALVAAVEARAAGRGHPAVSLSVSDANEAARRLYERLGFVRADVPPKRVRGSVSVRGGMLDVDDTLLYFEKPVDFGARRSS